MTSMTEAELRGTLAQQLEEERARAGDTYQADMMSWVPKRYQAADLATMDNSGTERLKNWNWGRSPLLFGKPGTGKSWGAAGLARELLESGDVRNPMWLNSSRYFNDLRASFSGDEAPQPPMGHDLYIVDDLGKERSTPWIRELLYVMFGRWYDSDVKFIVTTNLGLTELEQHVGEVVFDRLCELMESVRYDGPSRRRR